MEKGKITTAGKQLLQKLGGSRDLIYLITRYLPIKKQLQFRLVCKQWRHSISYSWKLQIIELEIYIQVCIDRIPKEFDQSTLKNHKDLSDTEMCITSDLNNYIKLGGKGDTLFSSIKEIGYLVKPNHLIQKPFFLQLGYCLVKLFLLNPKLISWIKTISIRFGSKYEDGWSRRTLWRISKKSISRR